MSDLLAWRSISAICLHSPNGADCSVSAQEIFDASGVSRPWHASLHPAFHALGRSTLRCQTKARVFANLNLITTSYQPATKTKIIGYPGPFSIQHHACKVVVCCIIMDWTARRSSLAVRVSFSCVLGFCCASDRWSPKASASKSSVKTARPVRRSRSMS